MSITERWSFERAQSWLNDYTHNKYIIQTWPNKASEKCKVLDTHRNVVFEMTFKTLKDRLKINKETIIFPNKEECDKLNKVFSEKINNKICNTHISNVKKITEEHAREWLKKNNLDIRFEIIKYVCGATNQCTFLDIENNVEFKHNFAKFKRKLTKNPNFIFEACREVKEKKEIKPRAIKKWTEELAKEWLLKNKPEYSIVRWGGKAENKSKFLNIKRNIEFEQTFNDLKKICLSDTDREFGYRDIIFIDGKKISAWADEKGCAETVLYTIYKQHGEEFVKDYLKKKNDDTSIEIIIENFLKSLNVNFEKKKFLNINNKKVFPDFVIEDKKLIIECDGLWWHCEDNKKNSYHIDRKKLFKKAGYESLFFREDEIRLKFDIVKSIIKNKLFLLDKIGANKCVFAFLHDKQEFIKNNHLMGIDLSKNLGKTFCLKYNEEVVAAMQVKLISKTENRIDITRFCTKKDLSVMGAFGKLLKRVIQEYKPNVIQNFIDQRYGTGEFLYQFGFEPKTNYKSFKWTDFKFTYHRGNKSYNKEKFKKIWDCGQVRWDLILNKNEEKM